MGDITEDLSRPSYAVHEADVNFLVIYSPSGQRWYCYIEWFLRLFSHLLVQTKLHCITFSASSVHVHTCYFHSSRTHDNHHWSIAVYPSLVNSSLGRGSCFHDNQHEVKSWKSWRDNNHILAQLVFTDSWPFFLYILFVWTTVDKLNSLKTKWLEVVCQQYAKCCFLFPFVCSPSQPTMRSLENMLYAP